MKLEIGLLDSNDVELDDERARGYRRAPLVFNEPIEFGEAASVWPEVFRVGVFDPDGVRVDTLDLDWSLRITPLDAAELTIRRELQLDEDTFALFHGIFSDILERSS